MFSDCPLDCFLQKIPVTLEKLIINSLLACDHLVMVCPF